jgi:hypothetical protein
MGNISFTRVETANKNDEQLRIFMDLWLIYMHEIGNERSDDEIINHGRKIIEIQDQKKRDKKIYNEVLIK